jgi:FkbM family methyltransferase
MLKEYLKHLLIRTPLEEPAHRIKRALSFPRRLRHPELEPILDEPKYVDDFVAKVLEPDFNCIDIGCHLGAMLSLFTKHAPRGRHLAFEPMPHKAAWLRSKFPDCEIHQLALSSSAEGSVTFYVNHTNSGYSGLGHHADPGDRVEEIRVQMSRLEDLIPAGGRIDFVKVDVEGAELDVLRGGRRILEENHPWLVFESTQSALGAAGVTTRDLYDFVTELDYAVYVPRAYHEGASPLSFEQFDRAHHYPFAAFNFLGVPKSGR